MSVPEVAEGSERPEPEQVGGPIWVHSQVRYRFCRQLAAGRRVLDIACANGYGTVVLAEVAAQVTGVDAVASVVARAEQINARPNVRYAHASDPPLPFADGAFDLIVCLETIEHLPAADQPAFVADLVRLLAPDGALALSIPDQPTEREHARLTEQSNPYHLHTPSAVELDRLLAALPHQARLLQVDAIASAVVPEAPDEREAALARPVAAWVGAERERPISVLRVCSRSAATTAAAREARPSVMYREDLQRLMLMWQALDLFHLPRGQALAEADRFQVLAGQLRRLEGLVRGLHAPLADLRGRVDELEAFLPWNRVREFVRARWTRRRDGDGPSGA